MNGFHNEEDEERQSIIADGPSKPPKVPITRLLICTTVLSAVGGFLFGYDTGVVSGAMIQLRSHFQLNYLWQELVVSVTIAGAWAFAIVAGMATDAFGRKPVILVASFVFTVGAVLMGVAFNKGMLLGGRLIVGAGIGLASMTVPVYIAEVAPAELRGLLVTINQVFITGGQFIASVTAGLFSGDTENGWRYMLALAGVPSLIQFVGFLSMPESPRWLASKGAYQEAIEVLRRFRGPTVNIEPEFDALKSNCLDFDQDDERCEFSSGICCLLCQRFLDCTGPVLIQVLRDGPLRLALIVGCALMMYYGATIIQMSGVHDASKAIWLAAALSFVNFACSFIGMGLVERVGRRLLTLVSLAGVIASLSVLALGFQLADMESPSVGPSVVPSSGICGNFSTCSSCTESSGCGYCFIPDAPTSNSTCLPVNANNLDVSLVGSCQQAAAAPFVWAYNWCPSRYAWMTIMGLILYLFFFAPGTFWLYGGLSLLGWFFFFFFLPETKGKSLEEVSDLFAHPWWSDSTTRDNKKTVQYVHIRGINQAYTTDDGDSGEEDR
ncbi:hypothetical protein HPB49_016509 [Dermacentor silvarum]|uniref:Uncharacterized protein n=1 Tax=Dermacentor silvarum TaxID=543639 RepID=A0ACB8DQE0_DERSI|nr:hypothetical protein HPB49_016509 [Dermacentor silvarum]